MRLPSDPGWPFFWLPLLEELLSEKKEKESGKPSRRVDGRTSSGAVASSNEERLDGKLFLSFTKDGGVIRLDDGDDRVGEDESKSEWTYLLGCSSQLELKKDSLENSFLSRHEVVAEFGDLFFAQGGRTETCYNTLR